MTDTQDARCKECPAWYGAVCEDGKSCALASHPASAGVDEEIERILKSIITMDTKTYGTTSEDAQEVEGDFAQKARAVLAHLARSNTELE